MGSETLEICARTRLEGELRDIKTNPSTHISFGPESSDDIFRWQAIIIGPFGTPLEGHIFQLSIHFPLDYPFNPPRMKFQTEVYHPNINEDGTVQINILGDQWSSALTTEKLLLAICSVLLDPIVDENPNPIPTLYQERDKTRYDKNGRGWTKQRLLRCLSRMKLFLLVRTRSCMSCSKPGRRQMMPIHHSL